MRFQRPRSMNKPTRLNLISTDGEATALFKTPAWGLEGRPAWWSQREPGVLSMTSLTAAMGLGSKRLTHNFFLFFRHTAQHARSEFPDQQSLNHWTTEEVPVHTVLTPVIKFMALRPEQAPSSALNTRKVHSTWEHWGPSSNPRGAVLGQRACDFYTALYKWVELRVAS